MWSNLSRFLDTRLRAPYATGPRHSVGQLVSQCIHCIADFRRLILLVFIRPYITYFWNCIWYLQYLNNLKNIKKQILEWSGSVYKSKQHRIIIHRKVNISYTGITDGCGCKQLLLYMMLRALFCISEVITREIITIKGPFSMDCSERETNARGMYIYIYIYPKQDISRMGAASEKKEAAGIRTIT